MKNLTIETIAKDALWVALYGHEFALLWESDTSIHAMPFCSECKSAAKYSFLPEPMSIGFTCSCGIFLIHGTSPYPIDPNETINHFPPTPAGYSEWPVIDTILEKHTQNPYKALLEKNEIVNALHYAMQETRS